MMTTTMMKMMIGVGGTGDTAVTECHRRVMLLLLLLVGPMDTTTRTRTGSRITTTNQ